MRTSILLISSLSLLALLTAACGATSRDTASPPSETSTVAPADTTPPPPTLSTLRYGRKTRVTVTFRGEDNPSISDTHPLVLLVNGRRVEAPLVSGPSQFSEEGSASVTQAAYALPDGTQRKLLRVSPRAVTVRVHDGTRYRSYPYVSGDLIE